MKEGEGGRRKKQQLRRGKNENVQGGSHGISEIKKT